MNTLFATTSLRPTTQVITRTRQHDMGAVPASIRSEWIKLRSLRSNRAILGLTVLAGIVMSWVLATFVKTDPYEHKAFTVANSFNAATWLTTVLAVIVGILMYTSEVQHGTISHSLAAQPARWVNVAGKVTVATGAGLAMGAVGIVATCVSGLASGMQMGETSGMAAGAAWGLVLTTMAAVLGVGIGMIIRHSSAAVSTTLVWTFVLENLIRNMAPANVSRLLPFSAANGMLGIRTAGDTTKTLAAALSSTQDALLFGGYTLVAVLVGTALLYRRDAE